MRKDKGLMAPVRLSAVMAARPATGRTALGPLPAFGGGRSGGGEPERENELGGKHGGLPGGERVSGHRHLANSSSV